MTTKPAFTNSYIAKLLRSISSALTIEDEVKNKFKIIAYERAADSIENSSSQIKDLWEDGKIKSIAGIGEGIASYLDELFTKGKVKNFTDILKPYPPAMFELLQVPGIGSKTAFKLAKSLGITRAHSALEKLEKAARSGHIAKIDGFGEVSQQEILAGLEQLKKRSGRMMLPIAIKHSNSIIEWMRRHPHVITIDNLGSLRRRSPTIGDLDFAVSTSFPDEVINHFLQFPDKERVIESGPHSASILLPENIQIDIMVQSPESYGSLLQHFTGSKFHNIALRELAQKKQLSLSEYGIKSGETLHKFSSESAFYEYLGLDFVPPELREDRGEIEAAQTGKLPKLIELSDIRGDLHVHSDIDIEPSHDLGQSSLSQLVSAARQLGYEYLGISEHNPSVSGHTKAQIVDLVKMKTKIVQDYNLASENESENEAPQVDTRGIFSQLLRWERNPSEAEISSHPSLGLRPRISAKGDKIHLFNGMEVDILADGTRALPDEALELLDYASVSIHSSFNQSKSQMTDRIIAGLDHPRVKFFAHPTTRLINQREEIEIDWERLFEFCTKNNKWLEIDSWPNRLDLPDLLARQAIQAGVKLVINSDSHRADHLVYMEYGVWVARRAWSTRRDIINSLSLRDIRSELSYKEVKI